MDLFIRTLNLQLVMFVYIAFGFTAKKLNIITDEGRKTLIDLAVDILMPVMIFRSFTGIDHSLLLRSVPLLLMGFIVCVYSYIIGRFAYPKARPDKRTVLHYDTLIGNVSFAGIPLAQALYGDTGVIYSSVYTLVTRVIMWTVGLSLFCGNRATVKETLKKLVSNPNIIATLVGIFWCIFSLPVPVFLDKSFAGISACVAPVSMIIVGSVMATVKLTELWDEYLLRYCCIRLLIIPLIAYGLSSLLHFDAVQSGIVMLLSAMPAPSTSAILAGKYGGNMHFASKLLFLSNILSIITVPTLMLVI